MAAEPLVRSERRGSTLLVTLDRPDQLNALSWELDAQLAGILEEAALDDGVRAAVLTGAGRAFSAGGDIRGQRSREGWGAVQLHEGYQVMLEYLHRIWEFPKPLVAAINGVAAGAGVGLALLCDVRLAAEEAKIGFAFSRVGLGPDWGVSWTLPRAVGPGQAARLLFSGNYIDAGEAQRIGLVEEVLPAEQLMPAALALCEQISERAPFAVRLTKEALRRSPGVDLLTAMRTEMLAQFSAMRSEDHREGTAAFAEKRPAEFRNR
jgi:2-(1,2-epoxy-1,2-dihydrophenyl)acetyl-CoA isomerase